ncbi:putative epidermal cell surface receptor [Saccostrea cucullata]|uniref:putative epidermal cell surface receptor n=1 Tax=Saccostrea cuccullata TaxID=36930 RepID=UPI002ED1D705
MIKFTISILLITATLSTCNGICRDLLPDCAEYTQSACKAPYDSWARKNCANFCGFCTPSCNDAISDCSEYGKQACVAPYLTWAKSHCASYCGLCSDISVPTKKPATTQSAQIALTNGSCTYKGQVHAVGETWLDGCDYRCTCTNEGLTQCVQPCAVYSNLPTNCRLEPVPGDCCKRVLCSYNQSASPIDTSLNLDQGCLYKNKSYARGQTFMDGCDYKCTCERNNIVQCVTPCVIYTNLPSSCHYETVPGDCCKKVVCTLSGSGSGAIQGNDKCVYKDRSYAVGEWWQDGCDYNCTCLAGLTTHCTTLCNLFSHLPPSCHYETVPGQCCKKLVCLNTTSSSLIDRGGCTYKNQTYKTGQTWQDGCSINCTCENGRTGHYNCMSTCPQIQPAAGCSLVKKNGKCCPESVCNIPNINTTSALPSDFHGCVYKDGSVYQFGDMWYDGCLLRCYCQNNRFYNCESRCVEFHLPSACKLEPPAAGKCCKVPKCPANYFINYPPGYVQE